MSDPTPGSGLGTAGAHPTTEPISPGVRNLAGINPNIPAPPSSGSNSATIDGGASHSDPKTDSHAQSASRQSSLTPLPDLPEAPPSRMVGGGYNATSHTIPTVSAYKQQQEEWSQQADEYARIVAQRAQETEERRARAEEYAKESGGAAQSGNDGKHGGEFDKKETMGEKLEESNSRTASNVVQSAKDKKDKVDPNKPATEKQRMMDQMNAHKMKPTERLNKAEKGQRRVRDPTTGGEIIIRDADPKDFDHTYPRANSTNILYHPFPAPQPPSVNSLLSKLRFLQFGVGGGLFVLWLSVAFGSGFWRFAWRSVLCAGTAFGIMTAISLVERGMEKELEAVRLDMHRQRGVAFSPPAPESVEWLNGLIKLVWGLLDPAFFVSIADMVEDILQQSLPGFIDAVRISDLSQGTNPLRILSIRALPDQPGDEGYPKTGWINEGNSDVKSTDPMKGEEFKEDDAGDYYNFEVAFSYSALPGQGSKARSKNIHLLIQFFIGMYDWLHIPIPIWIQVEQIFGIVRLRVQFIPEFPFVRNLTFALCGVPAVEVSAIPMSKHLPNILDLPFISSFVKMGIAAGTAELCVPKSMTLNLQEMLSGAAVGDTRAVGVFVITIHHCEGLSAQDRNGLSDPYVILAYAKFGKPLYSTRIILGDLNPVFEETCVLMLTEDEIKAKEDLSAMLWDSDKMSADDLVGRVQIPVAELMQKPNEMVRREDGLTGFEDANDMPGKLVWSIGYFTKVPLEKDLERAPTVEESKNQPEPPKTAPEMEMLPHDAAPNPAKKDIPPPPPDVQKTRPNPAWPSGVLSVILHQIHNLERQDLKGNSGEREGEAGQDTDEPSEQSDNLPSGYGEIIVNDEMVYKTRVKQYTTMPYFEAGTEVFVRDYRDTVVRVVIRDSRLREADPILGIVSVRLSEIFAESSSVTQVYAITEGIGFGKANISFAFRGMHVTLPRNMRGWDTGTLEVYNARFDIEPGKEDRFAPGPAQLRVVTAEKVEQFPKKECTVEGNSITWELESNEDVDGDGDTDAVKPLRMPIYSRYSSAVEFVIRKGALGVGPLVKLGIKLDPAAIAMLWLQDLTDDVEQEVRLPVLVSKDYVQLRQNVINDQTAKHHDFEVIGWLTARMKLDSGLDEDHEELRLKQSRRHALEAYDHIEGAAEVARKQAHFADDGHIDKDEQKAIDKAHKRQLEQRGRGKSQFKPWRTAKWMARGVKDRMPLGKDKIREPTVQSEA